MISAIMLNELVNCLFLPILLRGSYTFCTFHTSIQCQMLGDATEVTILVGLINHQIFALSPYIYAVHMQVRVRVHIYTVYMHVNIPPPTQCGRACAATWPPSTGSSHTHTTIRPSGPLPRSCLISRWSDWVGMSGTLTVSWGEGWSLKSRRRRVGEGPLCCTHLDVPVGEEEVWKGGGGEIRCAIVREEEGEGRHMYMYM